jgi:MtrB/PioB family decaheme-associated outer membrane protein
MRTLWTTAALLALGTSLGAQEATEAKPEEAAGPAPFTIREIEFGVQGPETDTASSRFREYRAIPSGFVLPSLHFAGNQAFRYDVRVDDALQADARYRAKLEPGPFDIVFDFQRIPHRFGNDGRTLHEERPRGAFVISDTLQRANQTAIEQMFATNKPGVNFAFLQSLVNPSIDAASRIDLGLERDRGRLDLRWKGKDSPLDVHVSYFQERRYGNRASGTSFGFGNVVESAEPIEYRTHDASATAEWASRWGLVRGGLRYNWFENANLFQSFDNPFRITDSTDASAYTAPASGSIGGAATGVFALPPDNQSVTGSLGFLVKLPAKTRVSADAALGRLTQDSPFIPFTSNTAVRLPDGRAATDLASLPARSLDGVVDTLSLSVSVTSRPLPKLFLTARYRRYDRDNKTARIEFNEGYTRFDAVWEDIARVNVPYGYTTDRAQLSASYDLGPVGLEGGYRYNKTDRTFREVEATTEGVVFGAVRVRARDWALLRASAETGQRDFNGEYEFAEAEEHSFLAPGAPSQLPELRRFDLAKKDTDRLRGQLQLTPGGDITIALGASTTKDDYKESPFGLVSGKVQALSADVDYTPSERWGLFAYASREQFDTLQRGRQSGASPSTSALDDWTSTVKDVVETFGGGANVAVVGSRLTLRLNGSYQRVDGNNALDSPPGGTPDVAFGVSDYDDTKIYSVGAELAYRASDAIRLSVGGWLEDYRLRDSATSTIATYLPGSIFLAANDGDYRAHVVYAKASYVW